MELQLVQARLAGSRRLTVQPLTEPNNQKIQMYVKLIEAICVDRQSVTVNCAICHCPVSSASQVPYFGIHVYGTVDKTLTDARNVGVHHYVPVNYRRRARSILLR